MKKIASILLITAAASQMVVAGGDFSRVDNASVATVDQNRFYVGAGISADAVNSYVYSREIAFGGLIKAGYNYSRYLGIEARLAMGFNRKVHLKHDCSIGLYLKPTMQVRDKINLYGLIGYARTKISLDKPTAKKTSVSDHTIQSGISFGAGISYKIDSNYSVFVDAVRYINKSAKLSSGTYAAKVDSITIGASYNF